MSWWKYLVVSVWLGVAACQISSDFPAGFRFGASTSSYQIEGGWNASDKGESIWDRYTHDHPDRFAEGHNGDVACDSYHQWRRDVEIAAELGLDFYRFSISWPRVLPNGFANYISEDGKNYYNNLINGLLEKGIEPMVTMYHWDLALRLQNLGGWANPLIMEWFGDYARVLYSLYSDRVKTWLTINEPIIVCDLGYSDLPFAPDLTDMDVGMYLCNKHVVLAHAKAWRIYEEEFKARDKGQISIVNNILWFEGKSPEDDELAELALHYTWSRFAYPIYSEEGGWPPAIEQVIAEKSLTEGFSKSRLPAFTREEKEFVRGTYDFMAVNQYTSRVVRSLKPGETIMYPLSITEELNIVPEFHPDSKPTGSIVAPSHPVSLRKSLAWLKGQYGDIPILITENGYASKKDDLENEEGVNYYKSYLEQVLLAIKEDGVNVTGYSSWSLMDNFEWPDGYLTKFGLYHVDFSSPQRTRTPRHAARYYQRVVQARSLNVSDKFKKTNSSPKVSLKTSHILLYWKRLQNLRKRAD